MRKLTYFMGAGLCVLLSATGCVSGAQVKSSDLPVKKVIVYRNGVAYFEREGSVKRKEVDFKVRGENIGDFLASLSVMEAGGSSVRSASFPVKVDEEQEAPSEPEPVTDVRQVRNSSSEEPRPKAEESVSKVTLHLDGKKHELKVGYIAATPIWRPSYRLIESQDDSLTLQVWGIVQNQSGEDWNEIELALISGSPISFESTLQEPVIPRRPVLSDRGDVVSVVPTGNARLDYEEAAEAEFAESADDAGEGYGYAMDRDGLASARSSAKKAYAPQAEPAPSGGSYQSALAQQVQAQAEEGQGGTSRFVLKEPVTIPDQSATMVLLTQESVKGKIEYVFQPQPGVAQSYQKPFLMAAFQSAVPAHLDEGPLSVFDSESFLGQGVLPALAPQAKASIPIGFAHGVTVESSNESKAIQARLSRIEYGTMYAMGESARTTTYTVKNGRQDEVELSIVHELRADAEILKEPEGSHVGSHEQERWLPALVPAHSQKKVVIEERLRDEMSVYAAGEHALALLIEFEASNRGSAEDRAAVRPYIALLREKVAAQKPMQKLLTEQRLVEERSEQVRANLESIKKNEQAAELRAELTRQLTELNKKADALSRDILASQMKSEEVDQKMLELLKSFSIDVRE